MTHAPNKGDHAQDWATPKGFFSALDRQFDFELDVCATEKNRKCRNYFDEKKNGLTQRWNPLRCWCNPPYGDVRVWLEKGWTEAGKGATVVYLVPASTDTGWFHDLACKGKIAFVKGRISFDAPAGYDGKEPGPNFGSLVVVFTPELARGDHEPTVHLMDREGRWLEPSTKLVQGCLF